MALHPTGVHHLAIATRDIKTQIEFFTDVLGGELKALYWMHGVANTFHGFVELSPTCYIAFQQHPDNPAEPIVGVTHAGNAGGQTTAGTMQHLALNVADLDELYAMRDRIRSRGIPVIGPMNHGMCQSMYFAGPEGLALEVACGGNIDARAWIDPEVQALAGISDDDVARYVTPAEYDRPADALPQPPFDPSKPHPMYPERVLRGDVRAAPDESMWNAVTSEPPVRVDAEQASVDRGRYRGPMDAGFEQYDLVIIGAGSGNTILGPAFDQWKVALVEEWVFGGTCLNRGCIPTKMFVHTADMVQTIEHTSRFGVDAHVDAIRWRDIRDRVFGRIDPIADGGERYRTFECPNVTVHAGRGRFVGARQLEVTTPTGTSRIEGRHVVIAAGARPMVPDVPGLAEVGYFTSDDIMRVDDVPEHLIVVGGGFIACELAHVFGSFGAKVSIVQRSARLLMAEDDDISAALTARFADRFDLHCGSSLAQVRRVGHTVEATLTDGTVIVGSHILVATGRVPNGDTLDVDAVGIATHPDGRIVTDLTQATSVPGVWALGDISSPYMLKHVANHEAKVVAHNLLHPEQLRTTDYRAVPHAVFTNPQIAAVGLTERDARAAGVDVMVSTQQYGGIAYGWALEDTTSFCKLVADRSTRRLVGAHIIGHHASSLIQQLVQGMRYDCTIDDMATGQYYIHPAMGELVENALLGFPSA